MRAPHVRVENTHTIKLIFPNSEEHEESGASWIRKSMDQWRTRGGDHVRVRQTSISSLDACENLWGDAYRNRVMADDDESLQLGSDYGADALVDLVPQLQDGIESLQQEIAWAGGSIGCSTHIDRDFGGLRTAIWGVAHMAQDFAVSGSAWVSMNSRDAVQLLGKDPSQDRWRARMSTVVSRAGGFSAGFVTVGGLGLKGSMGLAKHRAVIVERWLSQEELHAMSDAKGHHLSNGVASRKEWGIAADLRNPDTVPMDGVVRTQTSGTLSGALCFTAGPTTVGLTGSVKGSFERSVRKIALSDGYAMEVAYRPLRLYGKGVFTNVKGLADASVADVAVMAGTQVFRFNMNNPAARDSYAMALHGQLPGRLELRPENGKEESEALLQAWGQEAGKLSGLGIERRYLEKVEIHRRRVRWGFGVLFRLFGWQREREVRGFVASDGHRVMERRTRANTKTTETVHSGDESYAVTSTIERAMGDGRVAEGDPFKCVVVGITFSDTKVTGNEISEVLERLSRALKIQFPKMSREGGSDSAKMRLEYRIERNHFATISSLTVEQLEELCDEFEYAIPPWRLPEAFVELGKRIRTHGYTDSERGEAIQTFIRSTDKTGLFVLYRLFQSDKARTPPPKLTGFEERGVYDRLEPEVLALVADYPDVMSASDPGLKERFRRAYDVLELVEQALLEHDDSVASQTLMPHEWRARHRRFKELGETALRVIDLNAVVSEYERNMILSQIKPRWASHKVLQMKQIYPEPVRVNESLSSVLLRLKRIGCLENAIDCEKKHLRKHASREGEHFVSMRIASLDEMRNDVRSMVSLGSVPESKLNMWLDYLTGSERQAWPWWQRWHPKFLTFRPSRVLLQSRLIEKIRDELMLRSTAA